MQNYILLLLVIILMINITYANKPLIMAHRGGDIFGPENSLKAVTESLKYNPDIIEIDVKKSKDNIIFCYHGNTLKYLFPRLFFNKDFAEIKKSYKNIATLTEVANFIQNKSILFIHINDYSITANDLQNALKDINYKEIWVASMNFDYINNLDLPKDWKKINNAGISLFSPNKQKILNSNIYAIELNWWDYTSKNITELKDHNIKVTLAKWLMPKSIYIKKAIDNNSLWVFDYNFVDLQ